MSVVYNATTVVVPLVAPDEGRRWTPTQREIIIFARQEFEKNLRAPGIKDIANYFGTAVPTVRNHLVEMRSRAPKFRRLHQLPFLWL